MTAMKRRILCCAILFLLLVGILLYANMPERRIARFVARHGERLVVSIETSGSISANIGIRTWNEWAGEHDMWEFILWTRGSRYYDCYYSPDDVPLAFQNTDVALEDADAVWHWYGEGDNRGSTWRIRSHWYGFQAHF